MRRNRNPLTALLTLSMLASTGCGATHPLGARAPRSGPIAARAASGAYTLVSQPDGSCREAVLGAIDGAKSTIDLAMYDLVDREVADHLVAASKHGVAVRVLYEPDPFYFKRNDHRPVPRVTPPVKSPSDLLEMALPNADADVDFDPAPAPANYTSNQAAVQDLLTRCSGAMHPIQCVAANDAKFALTHEKAMVVDGAEALILTCNFTSAGLGANREYGVVDRDPGEVQEVASLFQADFTGGTYAPSQARLVVSPDDGSGAGNSRARLTALIGGAQHSIDVEDEEFGDPALAHLLDQKAAAGVRVRVLVTSSNRKKAARWFASNGVQLVGWAPLDPKTPGKHAEMHAKLAVVDGNAAYLGSVNLSLQSLGFNRELGIILSEPPLVNELDQDFGVDWGAATPSH